MARSPPKQRAFVEIAQEERAFVEIAQEEIGIGLAASASIAYRSGLGVRALWTDAERSRAVNPRNGSAAGGYLGKIDHWHSDRVTGPGHPPRHARLPPDLLVRRGLIADQAGFGGGAAHVE
jgi:hypothetical protein